MSLLIPATGLPTSAGKVAFFGGGGSGKTLTSVLLALGVSIELHHRAPIVFVDPEGVQEFVTPICAAENVPLFVVPSRTFVEMRDALHEAEDAGCCAFVVDHYDGMFAELAQAQKGKLNLQGRQLPFQHREELVRIWEEWVRTFRASRLTTIFNGRIGWTWGDDEDQSGDPIKVKLGTKMRGESDAGYEPNLLIELEAIQDAEKRAKKSRSKQGSIHHHAYVLKDRRLLLNGLHFEWKDLNAYKVGDYAAVWKAFAPHFHPAGTVGTDPVSQRPSRSSADLFAPVSGESAFSERTRRVTIAIEEINAALHAIWPGQTAPEKRLRDIVRQTVFNTRSQAKIDTLSAETIEWGWTIVKHFESDAAGINVLNEAEVVALIQSCKDLERDAEKAMVL